MIVRRRLFKRLASYDFGRRFIINFAYCERMGLFHDPAETRYVLDVIEGQLAYGHPAARLKRSIAEVIRNAYHRKLRTPDPRLFKQAGSFYRIVPISTLLDRTHPLLSDAARLAFGLSRGPYDEKQLRDLAIYATSPSAAAPGAQISNASNFAWVSSTRRIDAHIVGISGNEQNTGESLCRLLALEFGNDEPIFLLQYPGNTFERHDIRRPNAFDGFGSTFFKARTTKDKHRLVQKSGFTLDINRLPVGGPLIAHSSFDGLPEYAAAPVSFTSDFTIYWAGIFDKKWIECDSNNVIAVMAGTRVVRRATRRALDFICSL